MRLFSPCFLLLALSLEAAEFRVGQAAVAINPPDGTPLAGYYSLRGSQGVADPIFSKALVFADGEQRAAVVVCDLLTLPRPTVTATRKLIHEQTGIAEDHIMIAATHAHTGPVVARESTRDDLDGGSSESGLRYTQELPGLIAKSVTDAVAQLVPAKMEAAKGTVENLAYNRRFWMEDGTVSWNPAKLDPRILAPAGPHDPEVGVLAFTSSEKLPRSVATFVNYAMHPDTTGGQQVSADFPGVLAAQLSAMRGAQMLTIFANGACGNLNHRNVWWQDGQKGPGETARLGTILAGAVAAAWPQLAEVSTAPIRSRSELVALELPPITPKEIAEARESIRSRAVQKAKFMDQVKTFRILDVLAREGRPFEVEVQVIAVGDDVAFVSLPGEIFVELGLAIKSASPFRHTHIVELANGAIGYIPNRSAYAEGNYEVVSARCAEGSGERLVETAVRLLRELKP